MLKEYLKPELTRVEMRPLEASLLGCKSTVNIGAWTGGANVCRPGGVACKVRAAS